MASISFLMKTDSWADLEMTHYTMENVNKSLKCLPICFGQGIWDPTLGSVYKTYGGVAHAFVYFNNFYVILFLCNSKHEVHISIFLFLFF